MMQGYNEEQQQQRKKRRLDDEQQQPSLAALPPPGPPAKPKRPLSAYNLFFRSERDRYIEIARRQESEEAAEASALALACASSPSRSSRRGAVFQHLARHVAAKWNNLPEEERAQYKERAKDEKRRYEKEITQWHLKKMEYSMALGAASAGVDRQEGQPQQQSGTSAFEAGLGLGFTTALMEERLQGIMIPPAATSTFTAGSPALPQQATSSWMLGQSQSQNCIHPNQALPPSTSLGEVEKIPANCCATTTSAASPDCCQPPSLSGPFSSSLFPFAKEAFFEKITPPPQQMKYHYNNKGGNNDAATGTLKTISSSAYRPDQALQLQTRRDSNRRVASLEDVPPERAYSPQGITEAMSLASLKELKDTASDINTREGDNAFWMDPCIQSLVGSLRESIEAGDSY